MEILLEFDPVFQVYELAPLAVRVMVLPSQMEVVGLLILRVGFENTLMVFTATFEHEPLAPMSVYVVVTLGDIVMEALFEPEFQVYVEAPFAISVWL